MKYLILIVVLFGCQKEVIYPPSEEPISNLPVWKFYGKFDIRIYRLIGSSMSGQDIRIKDSLTLQEESINVLITSPTKVKLLVKRNDSIYFNGITDKLYIKSK
jgi:hypothetical protein